jgi:phospholipase C
MILRNLPMRLAGALAATVALQGMAAAWTTTSPIEHVVVIFQENVSFDHYFATYPNAKGGDGNPFTPQPGSPNVNGLNGALLSNNPNFNGTIGSPFRLSPSQAATCDQDHD